MGSPAELTVLGSGTAVPRADRGSSCYLLRFAGTTLLIDLGPGALYRAAAAGADLEHLDGVLLTHVHPDHCADLVALQFALMNPGARQGREPLPVFGHSAGALLISRLRNAWPRWLAPGADRFVYRTVTPGPVSLPKGWSAEALPMRHHESSLGWRLTLPNGPTVAFSGDTIESPELLELGQGADLFVLEGAGPDAEPMPGHLTPRRAGAVAADCGARKLLLTHFYGATLEEPIEAAARETFEGELTLAQDGLVISVSPCPETGPSLPGRHRS
ncbi:MAG: ribonuclease BN (tRNA processing enzyme) [Pseudohongiellaceae bacterium]|jgi:ribonuclease BN (tRNA processing enzyme)